MIRMYKDRNGKELWQVYVSVRSKFNNVRMQRRAYNIATEAEALKAEVQLAKQCERELIEKELKGQTWGHVVEEYDKYISFDKTVQLELTTKRDYVSAIRNRTKHWWPRIAAEINRADARELFAQLTADGISIAHQKKMKRVVSKVFSFGMDFGIIKGMQVSPLAGIQFPKVEEKKPEILTLDQIRQLLKLARDLEHPWYPVWSMALLTGCRNGELFALLWSDLDFENKIISLTKSYNTRMRATKSTKSGYWRTIPISSELETMLKELKLQAGTRKEVLPRLPRWAKGDQARMIRQFCQVVGLPSIKFHTLRACFATQLIRQGIPPIQIQKICGWKDLETMQRYVRLAGIEVVGATEGLKLLPEAQVMAKVVNLFQPTEP
jgi:integrase